MKLQLDLKIVFLLSSQLILESINLKLENTKINRKLILYLNLDYCVFIFAVTKYNIEGKSSIYI